LEIQNVAHFYQEQLDTKLIARKARETGGICPIRQELYGQTFGASCFLAHHQLVLQTKSFDKLPSTAQNEGCYC
jgi:hypothetical protein